MNILILGGASGLGKAITISLCNANANCKVFITYNKSAEEAKVLKEIYKEQLTIYKLDFFDMEEIDQFSKKIELEGFDVLINNATTAKLKDYFHKLPSISFEKNFMNNVMPIIKITQQFIKLRRKKKSGKIITILSSVVKSNYPPLGWSQYLAEKMYLLGLHKGWAIENVQFNITSNCVSPSFMQTDLNSDVDERILEQMLTSHPLKKFVEPKDIASLINYLIIAPNHINGENFTIDAAGN